MKSTLQHLIAKARQDDREYALKRKAEAENPLTSSDRRSFLKRTALGGFSLAALAGMTMEDTIAETTRNVRRASAPSDLKITDLR